MLQIPSLNNQSWTMKENKVVRLTFGKLENVGKLSLGGLTLGVNVTNQFGAKHKITGMHSLAK
jgi:hypothetical protein